MELNTCFHISWKVLLMIKVQGGSVSDFKNREQIITVAKN